jgi:hypothetical protein
LVQNTTAPTPSTEVGTDIVALRAWEFVKDLLGSAQAGRYGKKLTKEYLKGEEQRKQEAIRRTCDGQFRILIGGVKAFLSDISIDNARLTASWNTSQVLSKLAGVDSATKVETKIRKLIAALDALSGMPLIYNSEISKRGGKEEENTRQLL